MNLKQILDLVKTKRVEASSKSLHVFYNDEFPTTIYKEKHPHLSDGEEKYLKANYINPCRKILGDAIFETQKIFNDDNFTVESNNETINQYIEEYEIQSFFKNIYWQNILLDPDCILTYQIKVSEYLDKKDGIDKGNEYLPIHPYIVTSQNVMYRDNETLVYKVKGNKKNNFVAIYYVDGILTYAHYSYSSQIEKVEPILLWQFGEVDIKNFVRRGDGIKKIEDNELSIQSYFYPSTPLLSRIMFDNINLSVTQMRTTFPIPVMIGEPCDEPTCNGTGTCIDWKDGVSCQTACTKCNGTGQKNPFSPFSTIYVSRGNNALDGTTPPAPHMYWVDPPQGAIEGLKSQIQKDLDTVFDYIGISQSNSEVRGSETALGKMIDREKQFGTFRMYSQDIQYTLQWWYDGWTNLMFSLESDNEIVVNRFDNFRTISTAEVNSLFTELQNSNAPQYILIELLKNYYSSIGRMDLFELVNKFYLYKSDEMLLKYGSLGYYDKQRIIISQNIMKWSQELKNEEIEVIEEAIFERAKALMNIQNNGFAIEPYNDNSNEDDNGDENGYENGYAPINARIKEGDFVIGQTSEGQKTGIVEHIMWSGGTLGTPGTEYAIESMPPENPAMSIRIYEQNDNGELQPTAYSIGMMYKDANLNNNGLTIAPIQNVQSQVSESTNKLRETVGGLQGIIQIATAIATGVYDLEAGINLVSGLYGIDRNEAASWLGTPNIKNETELDQAQKLL